VCFYAWIVHRFGQLPGLTIISAGVERPHREMAVRPLFRRLLAAEQVEIDIPRPTRSSQSGPVYYVGSANDARWVAESYCASRRILSVARPHRFQSMRPFYIQVLAAP
jgi:hypothetical protein